MNSIVIVVITVHFFVHAGLFFKHLLFFIVKIV